MCRPSVCWCFLKECSSVSGMTACEVDCFSLLWLNLVEVEWRWWEALFLSAMFNVLISFLCPLILTLLLSLVMFIVQGLLFSVLLLFGVRFRLLPPCDDSRVSIVWPVWLFTSPLLVHSSRLLSGVRLFAFSKAVWRFFFYGCLWISLPRPCLVFIWNISSQTPFWAKLSYIFRWLKVILYRLSLTDNILFTSFW